MGRACPGVMASLVKIKDSYAVLVRAADSLSSLVRLIRAPSRGNSRAWD